MVRGKGLLIAGLFVASLLAGCMSGDDSGAADVDGDGVERVGGTAPPVVPGDYKFDADFAQVIAQGPFNETLPLLWEQIPSELDGAEIQIAILRPDVPEGVKVPVIIDAGPYYPADMSNTGSGGHVMRLATNFLSHGYAVGAVTVRGTADHGGCMDLMGPKERADLNQAVTWLGEQEWSNGKVAMIGASYDGSTPFEVASMGNPYLATIVPVSGLTDIYGLMYRNGTAEVRGPVVLNALYYSFTLTTQGRAPDHVAEGVLCPESWEGLAASTWSGAGMGRDPTGWWDARDSRPGLIENNEASILFVHGLQDWNVDPALQIPWMQEYADQTGVTVHQWLGQWGHAFPDSYCSSNARDSPSAFANCRFDYAQYLLNWFDYWMKGETTIDLGPPVHVQDHDRNWRTEAAWPPKDATSEVLELSMPDALVEKGEAQSGEIRLPPNPVGENVGFGDFQAEFPEAYVEFTTGKLESDYHISGLPKVHVTVVPEGPGGTVSAWLYKKTGTDFERVGWTSINLRFADGTEQGQEVVPGEELLAKMQIQPMDAVVPAGSELVLRMWTYPPTDRVYNSAPASVNLLVGDGQSVLDMPLIERAQTAYFDPPFPPGEDPRDEL